MKISGFGFAAIVISASSIETAFVCGQVTKSVQETSERAVDCEAGETGTWYRAIEENGFPNQINELKEDIKILLDEY